MFNELTVRLEELLPMRVAVLSITSETPEHDAITAMLDWARPQGYLNRAFRFFGYDNCKPYPNHTYTVWLHVPADARASDDVHIIDFEGGMYAAADVDGVEQIGPTWDQLSDWLKQSTYAYGSHPALEEHLDVLSGKPRSFRLYLPIR